MTLSREVWDEIVQHALRAYPEECCGIILGVRSLGQTRASKAVALANESSSDRRSSYAIDPLSLVEVDRLAESEGLSIVAAYHSHPDAPANFSDQDRRLACPWFDYLVVSAGKTQVGEARLYTTSLEVDAPQEGVILIESETAGVEHEGPLGNCS